MIKVTKKDLDKKTPPVKKAEEKKQEDPKTPEIPSDEPIEVFPKPFLKWQTLEILDGIYKWKTGEMYDIRYIFVLWICIQVIFFVIIDGYKMLQIDQNILVAYKPKNDRKKPNPAKKTNNKDKKAVEKGADRKKGKEDKAWKGKETKSSQSKESKAVKDSKKSWTGKTE